MDAQTLAFTLARQESQIEHWELEKLEILLEQSHDTAPNGTIDTRTALHYAAGAGRSELVKMLLEHGCIPNSCDDAKWTPLHSAASAGHDVVVTLLLQYDNELIDLITGSGATALHYACSKGFHDIVKILLKCGANPNSRDSAGSTPLIRAVANSRVVVVDYLLNHGCDIDVNAASLDGNTALHLACMEANLTCAIILMKYGANLNAEKNQDGKSPLDYVPSGHRDALLN